MEIIFILLIMLQGITVLTNLLGLPGGIISLIFPVIMFFMSMISVKILAGVAFVLLAGEAAEFYAGYVVGKRYGITGKGFWVSVLFAIVFGIVMAPLFFGIGSVIGTFIGAYAGALAYELYIGTTPVRAREKAKGVLFGRFMGTFAKLGAGFFALYLEIVSFIQ